MGSQFQSEYGSNGYQEENDHFYDAPASYTETLGSVPLGTDESNKELLDQLDQLRECGVDEYIDLPQVVVAGDQSSGKSSTLEALTGIPFPRDSVKCTKFATEIRLRRSDEVKTTVAIIPDNSRSPEQRKRLAEFEQMVEDQTDFGTIFENATAAIFAISSHNNFLSKDKLRIEISGPDQPHLMVVDLPGIIHAATDEQTPEDKEAILSLVQHYMQQERTIILPVVSCNNDYSNQVVLEMMKKCDPDGVRTLGIITKPDVTFAPKREAEFINLASNKDRRNRLLLGWHVVRNRSPQEGHFTLAQWRAKEAEFFVNGNWGANLPKDHLGVDALLKRLSVELNRHISAQVPKVKVDIELELAECRKKLLELGEGRDTPEQMREAISGWCQRSARITLAAVQGHGMNPSGETFFLPYHDAKTYARKFRNNLWQKNREFAEKMEDRGEDCKILDAKGSQPRRTSQRRDDVEGELLEVTRSQYIQQVVKPMLNNNKGQELPMDHNPLLVYDLFQLHSQNWLEYADNHIKNINTLLEDFLWQVLFYLWPNQLQKRFWFGFIQAEMENRISEAKAELQKIEMDRKRSVTPYERRLIERYNEWKLASHDAERDADQDSEELPDQTCEELLQKMLLVYDSKLHDFIANVTVQVVERHLADGLENIFHEKRVRDLSDEKVTELAQDDPRVRAERHRLRAEREVLENAMVICRQIGMRPDLTPYQSQGLNFLGRDTNRAQRNNTSSRPSRAVSPHLQAPSINGTAIHTPSSSTDQRAYTINGTFGGVPETPRIGEQAYPTPLFSPEYPGPSASQRTGRPGTPSATSRSRPHRRGRNNAPPVPERQDTRSANIVGAYPSEFTVKDRGGMGSYDRFEEAENVSCGDE